MTEFTPLSALIGGALIGVSAVIMMGAFGRIAGISGICGGALFGPGGERGWRLVFLAGLFGGPLLYIAAIGRPAFTMTAGPALAIVGGLLVGFGTRLGSGCTSGHGVCGLSRFSPRSVAATFAFMAAGFATIGVFRHVVGG